MSAKIQILLATSNGGKYIAELLDSLLEQTNKDWSVLIHDDHSTDDIVKIILHYAQQFPDRFQLLDDNVYCGSSYRNFSHLLKHSDANYIMFCDKDDVWLSTKIEKTVQAIKDVELRHLNKPILVHTDLQVVDENLNPLGTYWKMQRMNPELGTDIKISLVQNTVTGCTLLMNRRALDFVHPIPDGPYMHDWWVLLKILSVNEIVGYVSEPAMLYRQHKSNVVGANRFNIFQLVKTISRLKEKMSVCLQASIRARFLNRPCCQVRAQTKTKAERVGKYMIRPLLRQNVHHLFYRRAEDNRQDHPSSCCSLLCILLRICPWNSGKKDKSKAEEN